MKTQMEISQQTLSGYPVIGAHCVIVTHRLHHSFMFFILLCIPYLFLVKEHGLLVLFFHICLTLSLFLSFLHSLYRPLFVCLCLSFCHPLALSVFLSVCLSFSLSSLPSWQLTILVTWVIDSAFAAAWRRQTPRFDNSHPAPDVIEKRGH